MGIDCIALQALAFGKASGLNFAKTMLLGHQELHIGPQDVRRVFGKFSISCSEADLERIFSTRFADALFLHLGAAEVDSIDATEYESASIVHDMNKSLPESLKNRYTLVFDGGTLEHVFNFPVASMNVIKLTAIGGHIISIVPANNLCGHGFYQFSPELFFRVFGESNGCCVNSLFMADTAPHRPWHRVTDPRVLRRRVNLHHIYSTMMVTIVERKSEVVCDDFIPQQSDYEFGAWQVEDASKVVGRLGRIKAGMREVLPISIWSRLMTLRDWLKNSGYRRGYTRVVLEKVVRRDKIP